MDLHAIIVIVIICIALFLFVWDKFSADLVALLIMASLVITGVLDAREAISGFANPATLTVAFMFVISAAVLKTGVMQLWGPKFANALSKSYRKGMLGMMLAVALSSAFINNTPVVAIFIPVILQVAKRTGIPASRMLIPLSFASILGGMCTLIGTSTNILVAGMLEDAGLTSISMFSMSGIAILMCLGGILFFYLIGFKLLPTRAKEDELITGLDEKNYLTELALLEKHSAVGKRIMDAKWVKDLDIDIVEIRRGAELFTLPPGDMVLLEGDILKLRCDMEKLKQLKLQNHVKFTDQDEIEEGNTSLVELVVASQSAWEGKSLKQIDFRRTYRAVPLAIKHRQEVLEQSLHSIPLQAGDVVLAQMKSHFVKELRKRQSTADEPAMLVSQENLISFDSFSFAKVISLLLLMVTAVAFGFPMVGAALTVVCLLVLSKQLSMKELYKAVNWNIVFLMAGALSLGLAIEKTGLAHDFAGYIISELGDSGPRYVLGALFILTMLLTELMSNTAAAALMTPLAIGTAQQMDLSVMPFAIAVMLAASASFMTPIGYQTNTMIYAAGRYKFLDFTRVGWMLSIVVAALAIWLIPYFFNF